MYVIFTELCVFLNFYTNQVYSYTQCVVSHTFIICHPQQAARGVLQLPAQGQPGPRPQISGTRLSASTFPFFWNFHFGT